MHRTKKLHLVNHHDKFETDPEQVKETYLLFPALLNLVDEHLTIQYDEGMLEIGQISDSYEDNKEMIRLTLLEVRQNIDRAVKFLDESEDIPVSPTGLALGGITEEIVEDLDKTEVKLMLAPSEIKKLKRMGIIK